jgi:hypothetical protein
MADMVVLVIITYQINMGACRDTCKTATRDAEIFIFWDLKPPFQRICENILTGHGADTVS